MSNDTITMDETLLTACRNQFPALRREQDGRPVVYLDGPAGTQTPQRVIDAVVRYMAHTNANHGGVFATSIESDAVLDEAHRAFADFVGGEDPGEVYFGANMTSLTFALSRSLARTWRPGDEIIVTRLDHDANCTPWVLAARDADVEVRFADVTDEGRLDVDQLVGLLSPRTRLLAVGCASNASGAINPVKKLVAAARQFGALTFLDAVHYAPHALMDVADWDCDFVGFSAYKFFGPHVGAIWGRRELLESLEAYKVRPATNEPPGKWMSGTQNHEGVAGAMEAVHYLADLGRQAAGLEDSAPRRVALRSAMQAIAVHERRLSQRFLEGLAKLEGYRLWGPDSTEDRFPTFSITSDRRSPRALAEHLAANGLYAWDGNYYALNFSEAMGREPEGMVRIGFVHYNTIDEVDRTLAALAE